MTQLWWALLAVAGALAGILAAQRMRQAQTALAKSEERCRAFEESAADAIQVRKLAEEQSRKTKELLRAVIERCPLALISVDFDGHISIWNPAAESLFGWAAEEARAHSLPLIPQDQLAESRQIIEQHKRGGVVEGLERTRLRKDGSAVEVAIWSAVLRDASGEPGGILALYDDVSTRKRLEGQLQQSQKLQAIGRLAGGVSHDFNNLLTVISGYAEMLAAQVEGQEIAAARVVEILKACERASSLVKQLLAFSRRQMFKPVIVDMNELVTNLSRMLQRLIGEDYRLELKLAKDLGKVKADPTQLEQVVVNLVLNARDAMPDGGVVTVETRGVSEVASPLPTDSSLRGLPSVLLAVNDTGKGMDPDTLRSLFEPFFTTKEVGKGSGLGLATVYGIVKQTGGEIVVHSAPGRGSKFEVYLPVTKETEALESERAAGRPRGGSEVILLVEDEPEVRLLMQQILEQQGYRVLAAGSAAEAVRVSGWHHGPIDLMVTDVVLPGMDGPALAERMVLLRPEMRVIYTSGYTGERVGRYGAPPDAVLLEKPFQTHELLRAVRSTLDRAGVL